MSSYLITNEKDKKTSSCHSFSSHSFSFIETFFYSSFERKHLEQFNVGLRKECSWEQVDCFLKQEQKKGENIKLIFFLRHGKGIHNEAQEKVGKQKWENEEAKKDQYLDALLNQEGINQCNKMKNLIDQTVKQSPFFNPQLIISSPLRRSIDTSSIVFSSFFSSSKPIQHICLEFSRETLGKNTCDKRLALSELKQKYPSVSFMGFESEKDNQWTATHRETNSEIDERARRTLEWIFNERKEDQIVLSTHNGFSSACFRVLGYPVDVKIRNCELVPLIITYR